MAEPRKIGNFELLEKIGQGGMGAVFKARQATMDRIVALKILPPKFAQQPQFIERFVREARASARLNHPNIVNGIDVGEANGIYYFAMEYVEGTTLKAMVKQGRIGEAKTIEIAKSIARALAHAHGHGIIHRDIKPDNVLMDSIGTPKLCDLGLARLESESDDEKGLTRQGQALGTPHYISPEQARGKRDLDSKTDLYSLGATMYHMLTGVTMFQGATSVVVMTKHMGEKAPSPSEHGVEIGSGLLNVLAKLLAKDRADRYPTAEKLIEDLELVEKGEPPAYAELAPSKWPFKKPPSSATSPAVSARQSASAAGSSRKSIEPAAPGSSRKSMDPAAPAPSRKSIEPAPSKPSSREREVQISDKSQRSFRPAARADSGEGHGAVIGGAVAAVVVVVLVIAMASGGSGPRYSPPATQTANSEPHDATPAFQAPDERRAPRPESAPKAPAVTAPQQTEVTDLAPAPDPEKQTSETAAPAVVKPPDNPRSRPLPVAAEARPPSRAEIDHLYAQVGEAARDARFKEAAECIKTAAEKFVLDGMDRKALELRAQAYGALAEMKAAVIAQIKSEPDKFDVERVFGGRKGAGKLSGADDQSIKLGDPARTRVQPWKLLSAQELGELASGVLPALSPAAVFGLGVLAYDRSDDRQAVKYLAGIAGRDASAQYFIDLAEARDKMYDQKIAQLAEERERFRESEKETELRKKEEEQQRKEEEKRVVALPPVQANLTPGLQAEYFKVDGIIVSLATLKSEAKMPIRKDVVPSINFDPTLEDIFATGQPSMNSLVATWAGVIRVAQGGKYKFFTESNDGSRLFVNSKLVVDNDGRHLSGMVEKEGAIELATGDHDLRLEFFNSKQDYGCKLYWQSDAIGKEIVPPHVLFHRSGARRGAGEPTLPEEKAWSKSIKLMREIDPKKDAISGIWRKIQDGLQSDKSKPAVLQLPYRPPEEYDFRIIFVRLEGDSEVSQLLVRSDRYFEWMMGGWNSSIMGFQLVADIPANKNPTSVVAERCIQNGKQYEAIVQVRRDSVSAWLNKVLVRHWPTNFRNLTLSDEIKLARNGQIGISTSESPTQFQSIEVLEITGTGKIIKH